MPDSTFSLATAFTTLILLLCSTAVVSAQERCERCVVTQRSGEVHEARGYCVGATEAPLCAYEVSDYAAKADASGVVRGSTDAIQSIIDAARPGDTINFGARGADGGRAPRTYIIGAFEATGDKRGAIRLEGKHGITYSGHGSTLRMADQPRKASWEGSSLLDSRGRPIWRGGVRAQTTGWRWMRILDFEITRHRAPSAHPTVVEDLTFDGNKAGQRGGPTEARQATLLLSSKGGAQRAIVRRSSFRGAFFVGLKFHLNMIATVEEIETRENSTAVYVSSNSSSLTIDGLRSTRDRVGFWVEAWGTDASNILDVTLRDAHFVDAGPQPAVVYNPVQWTETPSSLHLERVSVERTAPCAVAEGCVAAAIYARNSLISIIDSKLEGAGGPALILNHQCLDTRVERTEIVGHVKLGRMAFQWSEDTRTPICLPNALKASGLSPGKVTFESVSFTGAGWQHPLGDGYGRFAFQSWRLPNYPSVEAPRIIDLKHVALKGDYTRVAMMHGGQVWFDEATALDFHRRHSAFASESATNLNDVCGFARALAVIAHDSPRYGIETSVMQVSSNPAGGALRWYALEMDRVEGGLRWLTSEGVLAEPNAACRGTGKPYVPVK